MTMILVMIVCNDIIYCMIFFVCLSIIIDDDDVVFIRDMQYTAEWWWQWKYSDDDDDDIIDDYWSWKRWRWLIVIDIIVPIIIDDKYSILKWRPTIMMIVVTNIGSRNDSNSIDTVRSDDCVVLLKYCYWYMCVLCVYYW